MRHAPFYIILLALFVACSSSRDAAEYLEVVEEPPIIQGGLETVSKHLEYPNEAVEAGVQGTVIVRALINEEGLVDDVEIESSPDEQLGNAAFSVETAQGGKAGLEAVREVRFTAGKVGGKPVKTLVKVPVKFRLN